MHLNRRRALPRNPALTSPRSSKGDLEKLISEFRTVKMLARKASKISLAIAREIFENEAGEHFGK